MRQNEVATITTNSRKQSHRLERIGNAGDERPDRHQHDAGEHRLDRSRQVEPGNQLELRDRRDEIAFVQSARLVVDEDDAAADHHHHEDRHADRSRQQILHVRHVRIDLDDVERRLPGDPRRGRRLVVGAEHGVDRPRERDRHEVVGVVLDRAPRAAGSSASTRRENSGGIVSTPLTRPLRRSVSACPGSAYSIVSIVRAPDEAAWASSRILMAGTPWS